MSAPSCAACNKQCRRGKLISCLHVLCTDCLECNVDLDGSVQCPKCGSTTAPKAHQSILLTLPDVCQEVALSVETTAHIVNHVLCEECAEDTPATQSCRDCNATLCDSHGNVHPRSRRSHNHRVTSISSEAAAESSGLSACSNAPSPCALHPSQTLTHYCTECNDLLCSQCMSRKHHLSHQQAIKPIADAAEKLKGLVRQHFDQCSSAGDNTIDGAVESVKAAITAVNDKTEQASAELADFFKAAADALKRREMQLRDGLDHIRNGKLVPLEEQLAKLQDVLVKSQTVGTLLETRGSDADFLRMWQWLDNAVANHKAVASDNTDPCVSCEPAFSAVAQDDLQKCIAAAGGVLDTHGVEHYQLRCPAESSMTDDVEVSVKPAAELSQQHRVTEQRLALLPIAVEVTSPSDEVTVCTPLTVSSSGEISSKFRPQRRGKHVVSAKMTGVHLRGSPATVTISTPFPFIPGRCHTDLQLSNGNKTVRKTGGNGWSSVCSAVIQPWVGKADLRVKIDETGQPPYMFLCVCNSANAPLDDWQRDNREAFGWYGTEASRHCNGGPLGQPWQAGDVVRLTLDFDNHSLTGYHERTGQTETLSNVTGNLSWYFSLRRSGQQLSCY